MSLNARTLFFFAVLALFVYVLAPLILPLAMGGVLAVLAAPWLESLKAKRIGHKGGAAILTLGITLLVLLPAAYLIFWGAKGAIQYLQILRSTPSNVSGPDWAEALVANPKVQQFVTWISNWVSVPADLGVTIREAAASIGLRVAEILGGLFSHIPGMALDLVIIAISLYFWLADGARVVAFIRRISFFSIAQTEQLLKTLAMMCRSVVLAAVVSAGTQALVESSACLVLGVSNVGMIALLVFVGSFIPVLGSAPITFGIALYQLLSGHTGAGIALLVVAIIVSGLDNLVRALFLQGSVNLHPLIAFAAALGGLQAFGFLGIFLGPIIAVLFLVTLEIVAQPARQAASPSGP